MAKDVFKNQRLPSNNTVTREEVIDLIQQQIADFAGTSTYRKGVTSGVTVSGVTITALPIGFTLEGGVATKTLECNGNAVVSGNNTGDQDLTPYLQKAGGTMTGDLKIGSDSKKLFLGASDDMTVWYDGTYGNIRTSDVGASDLKIITGASKTLVLDTGVYNDANVGSLVLQTGGTLPGIVEIVDNAGAGTGIYTRGFAVNEQGSGSIEIPHDYKEGTDLVFHIHWGGNDAPTGTDKVKWQLTYSIAREETTTPAVTTDSAETDYDTRYEWKRTDVETIAGASLKIGDQVNFTIKRIAASVDEFGGEALAATIGFHYQCDTLGSRSIGTK
jgi:hypothetical protein